MAEMRGSEFFNMRHYRKTISDRRCGRAVGVGCAQTYEQIRREKKRERRRDERTVRYWAQTDRALSCLLGLKAGKEGDLFSLTIGERHMRGFSKFGLSALMGVFCLMAGPAGAQESETVSDTGIGKAYSVFEYDPFQPGPDFVTTFRSSIGEGASNVFGPYTCSFAGPSPYRWLGAAEPPAADVEGVCDPASAYINSYSYESPGVECRLENTGQIFTSTIQTGVGCLPFSCFGEEPDPTSGAYLPQVGCTYTFFSIGIATDKDGTFEATTEAVEQGTYEEVEWDADRGLVVARTRSTSTVTSAVTFNIPEEDRPARDVTIEVPAEGSTMNGVDLISGWSCLGGELAAEFRNAAGEVLGTFPLAHGTARADTESACGDTDNGFSATMNWNLLGPGTRTIRLIQNGEELASQTFSVVAFEEEFITGASGMCSVDDFPTAGQGVTLEWDESQQRFAVTAIN